MNEKGKLSLIPVAEIREKEKQSEFDDIVSGKKTTEKKMKEPKPEPVKEKEVLVTMENSVSLAVPENNKAKLFRKLSMAVNDIGVMGKFATNTLTKGGATVRYASLDAIQTVVNPILLKYGLSLTFDMIVDPELSKEPDWTNNYPGETWFKGIAMLIDTETGEHKEYPYTFPMDDNGQIGSKIKLFGSTMTYFQRYSYGIIFNIPYAEDPDAFKEEVSQTKELITIRPGEMIWLYEQVIPLMVKRSKEKDGLTAEQILKSILAFARGELEKGDFVQTYKELIR